MDGGTVMTDYDPTPLSVALGFLAFAALAIALLVVQALIRHLLTRNAHPALVPSDGRGVVPTMCSGHYYRKTIGGLWQCATCGHMPPPVTPDDALDAAVDEFRGELETVEAFANREIR